MNDQLKEIADNLKDRELFPKSNALAKEILEGISRNEQLKQAIEEHDKQFEQAPARKEDFKNGMRYAMYEPSILRYVDPEIMKQAGWESSEWISVEDRLPQGVWNNSEQSELKKYSEQVNIFVDNGTVGTGAYNRDSKKWFVNDLTPERYIELERTQVTHWKPLPQPPKI